MTDARFEDGDEKPLRLIAFEQDDLNVMSALVQDAVFLATEMSWSGKQRQFSVLLNRFRWEDAPRAQTQNRKFERVQSVLAFRDVMSVKSNGFNRDDNDLVLSVLAVEFKAGEDGTGDIAITLAGDGEILLSVEALEASLRDVTRPHVAASKSAPSHTPD